MYPMAQLYTIVPTAAGPFAGLDPLARYAFGLIWGRYQLSAGRTDQRYSTAGMMRVCDITPLRAHDTTPVQVRVPYCVYRQAELAEALGCAERTARRCVEALRAAGVIETERAGQCGALRYTVPASVSRYLNTITRPTVETGKICL